MQQRRQRRLDVGLSPEQEAFVKTAAEELLAFTQNFTRGTFVDVVAWVTDNTERYSRVKFALIGHALKVAQAFGYDTVEMESHVSGQWLDYQVERAFKIKTSRMSGGEPLFGYDKTVSLSDMLDRLGGQVLGMAHEHPFTETNVTLIIEPGYPWPTDWYYSAKKRAFIEPEQPGWLMAVSPVPTGATFDSSQERRGVNPCLVFPPDDTKTDPAGPVFGVFKDGTKIMVAHSMSLMTEAEEGFHKHAETAAQSVRACGGLLFPSLSVGPIPATNFGPIVLVANLELVLAALKPYKERGRNPAWVYDMDVWTVGTAELMREVAVRLFEEFHGHEDWIYGRNIWALGPPADPGSAPGREFSEPLKTTSQLHRAIRRRMKFWTQDMTPEEFTAMSEKCSGTECSYAYCEAKAREVVPLSSFPYLITPYSLEDDAARFAEAVGFKGEIVSERHEIDDIAELDSNLHPEYLYDWAWKVSEIVSGLRPVVNVQ